MEHNQSEKMQYPAMTEVYQIYSQFQEAIDGLDIKIQELIKQNQAQFLFAYRNHIKKIKEQLKQIKVKTDEQQKKMMANDRVLFLEKQVVIFRDEALKMYNKLQEKTAQTQILKSKLKDLQKNHFIVKRQNKDLLKASKQSETRQRMANGKIEDLESQVQNIKIEIASERAKLTQQLTSKNSTQLPFQDVDMSSYKQSQRMPFLKHKSLRQPFKSSSSKKTQVKLIPIQSLSQTPCDFELRQWFLECIKTIRKEVSQRKAYNTKNEDITMIASIEQFRMIDKLRLLEMFMQNQKLLMWMYEKIFPTRINELELYLQSNKKPQRQTSKRDKSKSVNIKIQDIKIEDEMYKELFKASEDYTQDRNEPKFNVKSIRNKKYEVRSKVSIKNGKLNLSNIQS